MEMNITFDDWRDLFLIRKGEEFSETGLKILWKIAQKYVSEDDFIKPEINYIINIVSNSFKEFVLDDLIDKYDSNKKDIFRSFKNNNIEFYYSDGVVIIHQKDLHRLPKFI